MNFGKILLVKITNFQTLKFYLFSCMISWSASQNSVTHSYIAMMIIIITAGACRISIELKATEHF